MDRYKEINLELIHRNNDLALKLGQHRRDAVQLNRQLMQQRELIAALQLTIREVVTANSGNLNRLLCVMLTGGTGGAEPQPQQQLQLPASIGGTPKEPPPQPLQSRHSERRIALQNITNAGQKEPTSGGGGGIKGVGSENVDRGQQQQPLRPLPRPCRVRSMSPFISDEDEAGDERSTIGGEQRQDRTEVTEDDGDEEDEEEGEERRPPLTDSDVSMRDSADINETIEETPDQPYSDSPPSHWLTAGTAETAAAAATAAANRTQSTDNIETSEPAAADGEFDDEAEAPNDYYRLSTIAETSELLPPSPQSVTEQPSPSLIVASHLSSAVSPGATPETSGILYSPSIVRRSTHTPSSSATSSSSSTAPSSASSVLHRTPREQSLTLLPPRTPAAQRSLNRSSEHISGYISTRTRSHVATAATVAASVSAISNNSSLEHHRSSVRRNPAADGIIRLDFAAGVASPRYSRRTQSVAGGGNQSDASMMATMLSAVVSSTPRPKQQPQPQQQPQLADPQLQQHVQVQLQRLSQQQLQELSQSRVPRAKRQRPSTAASSRSHLFSSTREPSTSEGDEEDDDASMTLLNSRSRNTTQRTQRTLRTTRRGTLNAAEKTTPAEPSRRRGASSSASTSTASAAAIDESQQQQQQQRGRPRRKAAPLNLAEPNLMVKKRQPASPPSADSAPAQRKRRQ